MPGRRLRPQSSHAIHEIGVVVALVGTHGLRLEATAFQMADQFHRLFRFRSSDRSAESIGDYESMAVFSHGVQGKTELRFFTFRLPMTQEPAETSFKKTVPSSPL